MLPRRKNSARLKIQAVTMADLLYRCILVIWVGVIAWGLGELYEHFLDRRRR